MRNHWVYSLRSKAPASRHQPKRRVVHAVRGNKRLYVQVCADISNTSTRNREIRPYLALRDEITKLLVINRPVRETIDENGFTIIGATDFLLGYIK